MASKTPAEIRAERAARLVSDFGLEPEFDAAKFVKTTHTDNRIDLYVCDHHIAAILKNEAGDWEGGFPSLTTINQSKTKVKTTGYITKEPGGYKSVSQHMMLSLGRQMLTIAQLAHKTNATANTEEAQLRSKVEQLQAEKELVDSALEVLFADDDDAMLTTEQWAALNETYRDRFRKVRPQAIPADTDTIDVADDDDDDDTGDLDDDEADDEPTDDDDEADDEPAPKPRRTRK